MTPIEAPAETTLSPLGLIYQVSLLSALCSYPLASSHSDELLEFGREKTSRECIGVLNRLLGGVLRLSIYHTTCGTARGTSWEAYLQHE